MTPQRKTTPDTTTGTIDEQRLLPDWMMFPALNEAWMRSADGLIAHMEERSKTSQALTTSAPPAERARARLVAQSYIRVHAVLQELNDTCKKTTSTDRKTT